MFKGSVGQQVNSWTIINIENMGTRKVTYVVQCSCGNIRKKGWVHLNKTKKCSKCAARDRFDITGQTINGYYIIKLNRITNASSYWLCRCTKGHEKVLKAAYIKKAGQCQQCYHEDIFNDLTGKMFGKWMVLEFAKRDSRNKAIWKCECQCVFKTIQNIEAMQLIHEATSRCKRCALNSYYEELSSFFWSRIRQKAIKRNLEVSINMEYIWNLYIQQNKKCVFTGTELHFPTASGKYDGNLSLDRIDSNQGYIPGNVQWVYKPINFMKGNMKDDEFISICKMIAEYRK